MRNLEDIKNMSAGDYACGIIAHYKPLAALIDSINAKRVLEIGCAYGNNAEYILNNTKVKWLTSVDPYIFYSAMPGFICQEEYDILYEYAIEKLDAYPNFNELYRMRSEKGYEYLHWGDAMFDLIFLDGDHSYETVKWEIEHYYNLIKKGGILSGHDYNIFESVNKAVDEMANEMGVSVTVHDGNIWAFDRKP